MNRLSNLLIVVIVLLIAGNAYLLLATDMGEKLGIIPAKETDVPSGSSSAQVLTGDDLRALLPTSAKLKTLVGAEVQPETKDELMADQLPELRGFWPDAATRLESLIATYGLERTSSATYEFCRLTDYPIGTMELGVSQLRSPELARQYIDDPQALGLMTMFGTTYAASATLHGWDLASEAAEGTCYESEVTHSLVFEYWGMLFTIDIAAREGVTRAALQPLFDQLAAIMAMRVNVMDSSVTLPATPVPSAVAIEPARLQFPLTLEFLEGAMPTEDIAGDDSTLVLNSAVSRTYTLDDYVAAFQGLNLTEVANALTQVGGQTGMVGQVARVWDSQGACPTDTMLIGLEIDFALFQTASGTLDYLNNKTLQAAWLNTGSVTEYSPVDGDTLFINGGYANHTCGPVEVTELRQAYGRVLAAISFTHYPGVPQKDVRDFLLETMSGFDSMFAEFE